MWSKVAIIGCLLISLFVVHTALRIEDANGRTGTFLPRPAGFERQIWEVPRWEAVMEYVEMQIAMRRAQSFVYSNPGQAVPPEDEFMGAPYSESETGFIARAKDLYGVHCELHWWLKNFGSVQWVLAPLAFAWSVGNILALRKPLVRLLSGSCALMALAAIFLMLTRGYY